MNHNAGLLREFSRAVARRCRAELSSDMGLSQLTLSRHRTDGWLVLSAAAALPTAYQTVRFVTRGLGEFEGRTLFSLLSTSDQARLPA